MDRACRGHKVSSLHAVQVNCLLQKTCNSLHCRMIQISTWMCIYFVTCSWLFVKDTGQGQQVLFHTPFSIPFESEVRSPCRAFFDGFYINQIFGDSPARGTILMTNNLKKEEIDAIVGAYLLVEVGTFTGQA